jgi:hypothetical protein
MRNDVVSDAVSTMPSAYTGVVGIVPSLAVALAGLSSAHEARRGGRHHTSVTV